MKKISNLVALVMLVSTNVLTPFSYAQVETPELIPENEVGNVEKIGETPEKDNEITGEIPNSLGEVEGEGSLPLVREVVNESEPEGLKEEVEDSLDAVESPTTDENKDEDTEKGESDEVAQQEEENTKIEKQEEILEDNNEITEQENVEAEIQELQKTQEISTMDTTNPMDIKIEAKSTSANQTLKINKYFANAYTVDRGDGTTGNLAGDTIHKYTKAGTYFITLSTTASRRTFSSTNYKPLIPIDGTSMIGVKIVSMPSLAEGFGESAANPGDWFFNRFNYNGALVSLSSGSFDTSQITTAGNYFFYDFNRRGKLTSLPEGSFDTSKITTVGNSFFYSFNEDGKLTSLPMGSFNLSGITTVGDNFFAYFNYIGELTSLPAGSFDLSGITIVGDNFFAYFNQAGSLTSLPDGSFKTENIVIQGDNFFYAFNLRGALKSLSPGSFRFATGLTRVGNGFFTEFNRGGELTSLPAGSFDLSGITIVGDNFFAYFNYYGKLTSLPIGSFNTSNITTVGNSFFYFFNSRGKLKSLPIGSFNLSGITVVGDNFFRGFDYDGGLSSLPTGSFNITNITKVGNGFFADFNFCDYAEKGRLTSLPTGSFNTSNIRTVGSDFFYRFNYRSYLTSLPEGSFNLSGITEAGNNFFANFNFQGMITNLPNSFIMSSVGASTSGGYKNSFNSTNYTINKKVSDLVSGITVPLLDMDTFSDNQPGRCGVNVNWLVTTADACNVTYNFRLGDSNLTTKRYAADTAQIAAGSGVIIPITDGYVLSGWYSSIEGGEKVETLLFPSMNDKILYAQRKECEDGYVVNSQGLMCVQKEYDITYDLEGGYLEDEEGNKYEGRKIVTYEYDIVNNTYKSNKNWHIKRENSKFIGWYTLDGREVDFGSIPKDDNAVVYAKYKCDLGYTENEEKTTCEKNGIEFNANGGEFSNGDRLKFIGTKINTIIQEESKNSHTINLTDEGKYKWWQSGENPGDNCAPISGNNGSGEIEIHGYSTGFVHIEGAESLNVSIKYGGSSYCIPGPIGIWTGEHTNYDPRNLNHSGSAVWYLYEFPAYGTFGTDEFVVQGDSISIVQSSGCPNYGWYVTVTKEGVYEVVYESGALDDIPQPTREGHSFKGWYLSDGSEFDTGNVSTGEVTYVYAKWECADGYENKGGECIKKSSGSSGGGGGGGGGSTKTDKPKEEQKPADSSEQVPQNDNSASSGATVYPAKLNEDPENTIPMDSSISSQNDEKSYTQEFQQAYIFAKENGITTKYTIQSAQMDGKLTRIAMAKMLSQYAINVLGQTPDTSKTIKFRDVTSKKDADYDNGVTLAYQLGIMGQNMPNNKFRPNDEVTRAEFAAALSRMLYNTSDGEYKSTSKYYVHHMEKLKSEKILTNDNPTMIERRGYVMLMLMRSAK